MLYIYKGKIYVKPLENRMVEVKIARVGREYNVVATQKKVELDDNMKSEIVSISLEEAFNFQNKNKEKRLEDFNLD